MKNKKKTRKVAGILIMLSLTILVSCKKKESYQIADTTGHETLNTTRFHKLLINDQQITIKEDSGKYFFAHDIILTDAQFAMMKKMANQQTNATERSTITNELFRTWTNGVVYYTLNIGADSTYALTAMRNIAAIAPIRFIKRNKQNNYIDFVRSTGNNAALGMVGGRQTVNLLNSDMTGVITHEILHALGVNHEQCRPDRGKSIRIVLDNIPDDQEYNFNTDPTYKGYGTFDFGSIMMYEPYAFSSNGKPTITKLDGSLYTSQIDKLSQGDVNGLNQLY